MNTSEPNIDVIIPAFNSERFIEKAIASVQAQSFAPSKIIVVDDGSTDSTEKKVQEFIAHTSIPIEYIKKQNSGPNSARNAGLRASTAPFVAFLDADDTWTKDKLIVQMQVFETRKDSDLGLVYCDYNLVDENDSLLKNPYHLPLQARGRVFAELLRNNAINGSASAVLIKRNVFDKVGYFDESLRIGEDWDMWLRIAKEYSVDFADETLVHVRRHSQNAQSNPVYVFTHEMDFYKKWMAIVGPSHPVTQKWRWHILKRILKRLPKTDFYAIGKNVWQKDSIKRKDGDLISVIMPVYNVEKYLEEAIQSVQNQTFGNFELIIIDDSSTDSSKKIALDFAAKDARIRVVENRYDKGLAGALNTGLDEAKGAIIARADGDDVNRPNRLQVQYDFLRKYHDIAIVGTGYRTFGGSVSKNIFHPSGSIELAWKFLTDTYFCHPTVMFRKTVLSSIPRYPNTGSEDFAFFSDVLHKHKGVNIPAALLDYRQHGSNYSLYARPEILQSVHDTFLKNFAYYNGNLDDAELYFTYKTKHILQAKDWFAILKIELHTINAIRKVYKISAVNPGFILVLCKASAKAKLTWIRTIFKNK